MISRKRTSETTGPATKSLKLNSKKNEASPFTARDADTSPSITHGSPTILQGKKAEELISPCKTDSNSSEKNEVEISSSLNETKKIPIKIVRSDTATPPKYVVHRSAQRNQQYVLVQKDMVPNFQNNFDKILSILQNPAGGNLNVMLMKQQPVNTTNNGEASVSQSKVQQPCSSSIVTIKQSEKSETKGVNVTENNYQVNNSSATVVSDDVANSQAQKIEKQEDQNQKVQNEDDKNQGDQNQVKNEKENKKEDQPVKTSNEASKNLGDTNKETSKKPQVFVSQEQEIKCTPNSQETVNNPNTLRVTNVIPLRTVSMSKPDNNSSGGLLCTISQQAVASKQDMNLHTLYLAQNNTPGVATHASLEAKHNVARKEVSKLEACLKQPTQSKSNVKKKTVDPVLESKYLALPLNEQVRLQAQEIQNLNSENQKLRELNTTLQSRLKIVYQLSQSQQRQEEMLLRVMEQLPMIAAANSSTASAQMFPPVSTMINNEVHLGQGVWLAKREFDRVMNVATTPSLLVRNLGVAVYGEEVLKCSSVLGKPCMRFSERASRPPLSPTRYTAIKETFDYWLTKHGYCGQRKIDELTHVTQYLGSKIQDLNRPEHLKHKYHRKKKAESETSDTAQSGTSTAPVRPRPRGVGRRKKRRILPFPPEWNHDVGDEEWLEDLKTTDSYIKLEPADEGSQDAQDFLESLAQTSSSNE